MTGRCLIIETDPIWVRTIQRALASPTVQLESQVVTRPEDALEQLKNNRYDLVTLDLSLDPDKRFDWGKNLLAEIKLLRVPVPSIVVISGTQSLDDLIACINDYHDLVFHFAQKNRWQHLSFVETVKGLLAGAPVATDINYGGAHPLPPVFISHTGETLALRKLIGFLNALAIPHIIAEREPKLGRSVKQHVDSQIDRCGAGLILKSINTSRSVLVEQGALEQRFGAKVVYLVERGTAQGPLEQEKVYASFTDDNMEDAFISVAREFRAWGYLG